MSFRGVHDEKSFGRYKDDILLILQKFHITNRVYHVNPVQILNKLQ